MRGIAVAAAPVGLLLYLAWHQLAFGDALAPLRIATDPVLRGGSLVNPFTTGDIVSVSAHVFWVGLAVGLLVVCARRMPAGYAWFSAAALLLAVNSRGFLSFERVASIAFPLVVALSLVLPVRSARAVGLAAAGALCAYTMLAALTLYVP